MDPYFHDVTIGLFFKEPVMTIYSYSNRPGLEERLKVIRDRIVDVSGAISLDEHNQATFPCSMKDGCCSPPLRLSLIHI